MPASARTCCSIGVMSVQRPFDHAAAQADVVEIQHRRLARCDRALRLIETEFEGAVEARDQYAVLVRLPVARLGAAAQWQRGWSGAPDPVHAAECQRAFVQARMVGALRDD